MNPSYFMALAKVGCKSKTGKRVYLEAYRIGGTNVTSIERLQAFIARINDEEPGKRWQRRPGRARSPAEYWRAGSAQAAEIAEYDANQGATGQGGNGRS